MNEIKLMPLAIINDYIVINNENFYIYDNIIDYSKDGKCRPIREYFTYVSPDYNPSANFKICAKSKKSLVKMLEKIDYKIVRVKK